MGAHERVTVEEVVAAYKETGSVWKAAKLLGLCGQSVWERLKHIGWNMQKSNWTTEEVEEMTNLSQTMSIGEIARRLGRPYYGVASQMSRRGVSSPTRSRKRKIPRGSGMDKVSVQRHLKALEVSSVKVTQFCRANGLSIDLFVHSCQTYFRDRWDVYVQSQTDLRSVLCAYCQRVFYPMSAKQKTCSRKCQGDHRSDKRYFGGQRRFTIGLQEKVCQLCGREDAKGLSSHHVLGKENDPDNTVLIALCPGCHQIVGSLGRRKFIETEIGWENLITLCMARRLADRANAKEVGVHACVDLEWLTEEDLETL